MKKLIAMILILLLALSVMLGLRGCRKPEEIRIVFPFEPGQVANVELFYYESVPAEARKKVVSDPAEIQALYQSFCDIACLAEEPEIAAASSVYSFRFNLEDETGYDLIYVEYGVKNGEILSPSGDFRYFTSANIGANWYNCPADSVPAEAAELPGFDGSCPTVDPAPLPTATELANPFDAILYENGTFWDSVYGEVTLSEYCEKFHEDTRIFAVPLKAAYVDMDNDWTEELAVAITELEDTLILHIREGRVEGREFPSVMLESLKADGTFRFLGHRGLNGISVMEFNNWATRCIAMENPEEEQVYYIDPDYFPGYQDMDPEAAFREISEIQDNKPDAPWFDLPHEPIPTDPPLDISEKEQELVDVVTKHNQYYDLDTGEMTTTLAFLNEFSERTQTAVTFLQQAALDFDGDGWERQVIHQVDYNMDTMPFRYMVDGAQATREEFDRAMDAQLAKEDVTWVGMENTLDLFR